MAKFNRSEVMKKLWKKRKKEGFINYFTGKHHTKKSKQKMSNSRSGILSFRKGKTFNEEYGSKRAKEIIEKTVETRKKNYKKENHYNYGKKLSKATKQKKSISLKKAYEEGRMNYMKDVWKENSKRWLKEGNPRWRKIGDIKYDTPGYAVLKTENGWCQRARINAEKKLGRKLKKEEIIHHINYVKNDDRIKNLYLFKNGKEHGQYHGANCKLKKIGLNKILVSNL